MARSTLIRADHLPRAERFERWRETLRQTRMAPVEVDADDQADFRFELRWRDLGPMRLVVATASPYRVRRTPRMIRSSDPDLLTLGMMLRGRGALSQHDRQADARAGGFVVYPVTRPYHIEIGAAGAGPVHMLMLHFPPALLPLPPSQLRQLTAVTMPASAGIGALTSRFLAQLAGGIDHYSPTEAARLATAALEVLATRLAHELDGVGWLTPEAQRGALLARIHAFIRRHLGDPDLSPGTVAAAHHISLSYLHKLFHAEDVTVAGWIRRRRLEAARRDLADPALASRPVAVIAARQGFSSPAQFSQAFKAAHGMPPGEYRRRAAGTVDGS
jgi:AraC-like DNA-binding protein